MNSVSQRLHNLLKTVTRVSYERPERYIMFLFRPQANFGFETLLFIRDTCIASDQ